MDQDDFNDDFIESNDENVQIRWEDVEETSDNEYVHSLFEKNNIVGFYKDEQPIEQGFSTDGYDIDEIERYLSEYLRFYSKEERDFIYLNFLLGKSQVELMEIFKKTQPALCNDSNRIKRESGIVKKLKGCSREVTEFLSKDNQKLNYFTKKVLLIFFYSMSVTKTSKILGLNPMLCRARIESSIETLKEIGENKIYSYFQYILENLNKLKRTVSKDLFKSKLSKSDYSDGNKLQEFDFDGN